MAGECLSRYNRHTYDVDAQEAEGRSVGVFDRLGDGFAHAANHSTAHKWICAAWRDAAAAAAAAELLPVEGRPMSRSYCACVTAALDLLPVPPRMFLISGSDMKPPSLSLS